MRRIRVTLLALAVLALACSAAVPAARDAASPAAGVLATAATASARATNPTSGVLYVRTYESRMAVILAIDLATGRTLRTMKDGALSAKAETVYWTESVTGAAKTTLHVTDVATGRDLRTFVVDGDLQVTGSPGTVATLPDGRLTPDGAYVALSGAKREPNGVWVTRLVLVDTRDGSVQGSTELRGASTYGVVALASDGRSVLLEESGAAGGSKQRVFDVRTRTVVDAAGDGAVIDAYRTPALRSPDMTRIFRLDVGHPNTNCTPWDGARCVPNVTPPSIVAFDLAARRSSRLPLPIDQLSGDWERYMMWSLALSADGATLYAVNPALGVVDEIDARSLTLRRTGSITVSRAGADPFAVLARLVFPVAEAKRISYAGAALSADGRTLYAAGEHGIAVIDTQPLTSRATWQSDGQFDALRLSADGRRLYGADNARGMVAIVDAGTGQLVGKVRIPASLGIVRVDAGK